MTPTQRAAAERLAKYWSADDWPGGLSGKKMDETAALLRELLAAEPAQEPVAWGVFVDDELFKPFNCKDEAVDWFQAQYNHGSRYDYLVLPLYAAPQQPMRCPTDGGECGAGGYCRPEPQQRKPLTDKQIEAILDEFDVDLEAWKPLARAIERAITGEPT